MPSINQSEQPLIDEGYDIEWVFTDDLLAFEFSENEAPGMLPCLVADESKPDCHKDEEYHPSPEYGLLCGILLCWNERGKFWTGLKPKKLHAFLQDILERLRPGFGCSSMEELILETAASARLLFGLVPACRILLTGTEIEPGSARIRHDLMQDVWATLEYSDRVDRTNAFTLLIKTRSEISPDDLRAPMVETLDYMCMAALSLLGRHEERDIFFWQYVAKPIVHPMMKDRMLRLLEDPHPNFDDYRVLNPLDSAQPLSDDA